MVLSVYVNSGGMVIYLIFSKDDSLTIFIELFMGLS